jgi:hypothetical protein
VRAPLNAQDWSSQRIIREREPAVLAACSDISALLSDANIGSL